VYGHGGVFFWYALLPRSDVCEEQGDVSFCYALSCFDNCPEKRDEFNPHTIGIGWLKFIPFFGTLQSLV